MARGRMLSTSVAEDKRLNSLSERAELAYLLTIPHLDRDGLIIGDPGVLACKICPRRPELGAALPSLIQEWIDQGLVIRYDGPEDPILFFKGFKNNQTGMVYDREAASKFPPPPGYVRGKKGLEPVNGDDSATHDEVMSRSRPDHDQVAHNRKEDKEKRREDRAPARTREPAETQSSPPPSKPYPPSNPLPPGHAVEYRVGDYRTQRSGIAEIQARARRLGLTPVELTALTDALLDRYGQREIADAGGDYGDRVLRKAQEIALGLAALGCRTPADLDQVWRSWMENDWRSPSPPTGEQLIEHAGKMRAGTVVCERKEAPTQTAAVAAQTPRVVRVPKAAQMTY